MVEPLAGSRERARPPFFDDDAHPDRSLRWWAGNAGKRSVCIDLGSASGPAQLRSLIATADVVFEGGGDALTAVDCDYRVCSAADPSLIWVSVTPYGRASERAEEPFTDLTLQSGSGPVWNCGYDDHAVPPMHGGGEQSLNVTGLYAAIGALTALAERDQSGRGQLVDVSATAAGNVTAEQVTYHWLLNQDVCVRQTGRHAYPVLTAPVQVRCGDGRYVTTGVLPRSPAQFAALRAWLDELALADELPEAFFLDVAAARDTDLDLAVIGHDAETTAILSAARDAITLIASHVPAQEFYLTSQRRGFPAGAVLSADEAFEDEHLAARGFPVEVEHPELGRTVRYPGSPYLFSRTPTTIQRRAPLLGEHDALLDELGGSR